MAQLLKLADPFEVAYVFSCTLKIFISIENSIFVNIVNINHDRMKSVNERVSSLHKTYGVCQLNLKLCK